MIKRLFILILGIAVFIGIPYIFGTGFIFISWLPAIFVMFYLEG